MEGLLPTPKASDALAERSRSGGRPPERSTALGMQIGLLPTPRLSDANGPGAHGDGGPNLNTTMNDPRHYVPDSMFIPTPRASDVKGFNQRRNQENLTGAMLLGVESDTSVKWGRFEPAIRRWERVLDRPAPCPLQVTGSLRERLDPLADTLLNPCWLVFCQAVVVHCGVSFQSEKAGEISPFRHRSCLVLVWLLHEGVGLAVGVALESDHPAVVDGAVD